MDLDSKISALKDFTSFGSLSKNDSSSSRINQSSNSSSSNGWGNWIAKGEKDPFLPSLVGFDCIFFSLLLVFEHILYQSVVR